MLAGHRRVLNSYVCALAYFLPPKSAVCELWSTLLELRDMATPPNKGGDSRSASFATFDQVSGVDAVEWNTPYGPSASTTASLLVTSPRTLRLE